MHLTRQQTVLNKREFSREQWFQLQRATAHSSDFHILDFTLQICILMRLRYIMTRSGSWLIWIACALHVSGKKKEIKKYWFHGKPRLKTNLLHQSLFPTLSNRDSQVIYWTEFPLVLRILSTLSYVQWSNYHDWNQIFLMPLVFHVTSRKRK